MVTFEMLTGLPPWFTTDRKKLFSRIRGAKLVFPHYLSSQSENLIASFLDRDPIARLGSGGIGSIKLHPFFAPIDWKMLAARKLKAPFKPDTGGPTKDKKDSTAKRKGDLNSTGQVQDYSKLTYNFNPEYARLPFESEDQQASESTDLGHDFDRFTFDASCEVSSCP